MSGDLKIEKKKAKKQNKTKQNKQTSENEKFVH